MKTKKLNKNRIALGVKNELRKAGLSRNSESIHDYEQAKRIVFGDRFIDDQEQYFIMHKAITDYLKV